MPKKSTQPEKPAFYIFDIETISQPEDVVRAAMPRDLIEPKMPADLENGTPPIESHKGMAKKIEKLRKGLETGKETAATLSGAITEHEEWQAAKREEWRQEKQIKIEKWRKDCMDKEVNFIDRANLNAETAIVPLICCIDPVDIIHIFAIATQKELNMARLMEKNPFVLHQARDEADMLAQWWKYVSGVSIGSLEARMSGWNTNGFDLPMLRRRSWILKVQILVRLMTGRYVDSSFWHDCMEEWQCGNRQLYMGVNAAAKALGCTRLKSGDGGFFPTLWARSKTDAILYCMDDVLCEKEVCNRIMQ